MKALFVTVDILREAVEKLGLADQIDPSVFFQQLEEQVFKPNSLAAPTPPFPPPMKGSHSAMDANRVKCATLSAENFATQRRDSPWPQFQSPNLLNRGNQKSIPESVAEPANLSPGEMPVRHKLMEKAEKGFKDIPAMEQPDFVTKSYLSEPIVQRVNLSPSEIAVRRKLIEESEKKSSSESVVKQANLGLEEIALRRKLMEEAEKCFKNMPTQATQQPDFITQANQKSFPGFVVGSSVFPNLTPEEIAVRRKQIEEAEKCFKNMPTQQPDFITQANQKSFPGFVVGPSIFPNLTEEIAVRRKQVEDAIKRLNSRTPASSCNLRY